LTVSALVRHADVQSFAGLASPWLLQSEAEHNLILGIIEQLKAAGATPNVYLATIEQQGDVVGCAFRTPPYKLGITRMPHGAVSALVEDVAQVYADIPAVLGPPAQARAFAEAWALCKNKTARPGMRQRIYELRQVVLPATLPPGELRLAGRRDLDVVISWLEHFATETGVPAPNVAAFVANHINHKTLFLWEAEGEPRTAAVYAGKTPHGVRIGFVYTPPPFRRRGYATACTALVSQRALDNGNAFCCLYTDLSNPTSNDIYQRIGYTPVCDVADYVFE
jgi:hypothetical protein